MFADFLARKLKRVGIHYGWVMASLAFLTTVFSSATLSVPQLLILPLTETFHWNISDVSTSIAIMYVILASIAPFGGGLMLRLGMPTMVLISVSFTIVGLATIIISFETWHLLFNIGFGL